MRFVATLACVALPPALIAVVAFSGTIHHGFTLDDRRAVVLNHNVFNPEAGVLQLFQDDFWGDKLGGEGSHKSYRPLTTLTLRFDRYRARLKSIGLSENQNGVPHPEASVFHCTNVVLHALASAAVALSVWHAQSPNRSSDARRYALAAAYAGMLFASHPVHVENVASIVGRADILSLLCLLTYLSLLRGPRPHWLGAALAIPFGTAAGLCKETAAPCLLAPAACSLWAADWRTIGVSAAGRQSRIRGVASTLLPLMVAALALGALQGIRNAAARGGIGHDRSGRSGRSESTGTLTPALTRFEWIDAPTLIEATLAADSEHVMRFARPELDADQVMGLADASARVLNATNASIGAMPMPPRPSTFEADTWTMRLGPTSVWERRLASALELLSHYVVHLLLVQPWPAREPIGSTTDTTIRSPSAWARGYSYDYSFPAWAPSQLSTADAPDFLWRAQRLPRLLATATLVVGSILLALHARGKGHDTPDARRLQWVVLLSSSLVLPTQVLLPLGVTCADRLAYIPSVSAAALAGDALFTLAPVGPATAVATAVVAAWLQSTLAYADDWRTDEHLFLGALQGPAGSSCKVQFNAAVILMQMADRLPVGRASRGHDACTLRRRASQLFEASAVTGADSPVGWLQAAMLRANCGKPYLAIASFRRGLGVDCLSAFSRHRSKRPVCVSSARRHADNPATAPTRNVTVLCPLVQGGNMLEGSNGRGGRCRYFHRGGHHSRARQSYAPSAS